jgi:hypothetical protein
MEPTYQYGSTPTRNPFRWLLAAWRVSKDLSNTGEAAIVEIGFSRSWVGRKFAGWERTVELLSENESTLAALRTRRRLGPINIDVLANEPENSLGRVFAGHCRQKGIDPNLVSISVENDNDFVMAHLFETHDIWPGWFFAGATEAPAHWIDAGADFIEYGLCEAVLNGWSNGCIARWVSDGQESKTAFRG